MRISFRDWFILLESGGGEASYGYYFERALKVFEIEKEVERGKALSLFVGDARTDKVTGFLVSAQERTTPGFSSGLLVSESTGTLFLGINEAVYCFDLKNAEMLWEDSAEYGFWRWQQHSDIVVMEAECEMAAWTEGGQKLWTTWVEPPWDYRVEDGIVTLDVMGEISQFPLKEGRPQPEPKKTLLQGLGKSVERLISSGRKRDEE